ncbi:hypothetical protein HOR89_gp047 [Synechococcus phage Bellamy]|jgi:hypothetical protein|uniref:Uncharacterized protein n=1 Tax=Synechococcus phage Bellamy TaxID=2023996 RepID=A0A222YW63_9CAUD|nr:hypothetical protein HOR89_gp047 [Synechococcus phage Bellamy]ASR76291.1 hypothetical protein PBI_BELLAMY_255 [Synechococcus phage Bellamy]
MPIPDIRLNNINIRDVVIPDVPKWMSSDPPVALPVVPPITMEIGTPIVNIPGCVEAHKDNKENVNLKNEDDKGVMTLCDAGTPYYTALDYDRNKIKLEQKPPEPPAYKAPPAPEAPETKTPAVPKTEAPMPECPTREQQLKNPIGKILEGNKKITGYEMVGKECLMVTEQLSIPDQIIGNIPNAGAVTTTASIAVVATTSALLAKPLADLLLKVVKPTVKKVMKKVATLRGKKIPVQSKGERLAEQRQRNQAVKALRSVRPLKK